MWYFESQFFHCYNIHYRMKFIIIFRFNEEKSLSAKNCICKKYNSMWKSHFRQNLSNINWKWVFFFSFSTLYWSLCVFFFFRIVTATEIKFIVANKDDIYKNVKSITKKETGIFLYTREYFEWIVMRVRHISCVWKLF